MLLGDMEIEIQKSWYNKTEVQSDGITHIVDTEHKYPVYQFGLGKNYFGVEERSDVVRAIIRDLKQVIKDLNQMLEQEEDKNLDR